MMLRDLNRKITRLLVSRSVYSIWSDEDYYDEEEGSCLVDSASLPPAGFYVEKSGHQFLILIPSIYIYRMHSNDVKITYMRSSDPDDDFRHIGNFQPCDIFVMKYHKPMSDLRKCGLKWYIDDQKNLFMDSEEDAMQFRLSL